MIRRILVMILLVGGYWLDLPAQRMVSAYIEMGHAPIYPFYGGLSMIGEGRLARQFTLQGGLQLSSKHATTAFGSCYISGAVDFPLKRSRLLLNNKILYNYYSESNVNQIAYRIDLQWESKYVDLGFGNTFRYFNSLGSDSYELFNVSFLVAVRVRPLHNNWNIILTARNFDDFAMDKMQSVRFALGGYYDIDPHWGVFAEYVLHPQGNFNMAAQWYASYGKLGARYVW